MLRLQPSLISYYKSAPGRAAYAKFIQELLLGGTLSHLELLAQCLSEIPLERMERWNIFWNTDLSLTCVDSNYLFSVFSMFIEPSMWSDFYEPNVAGGSNYNLPQLIPLLCSFIDATTRQAGDAAIQLSARLRQLHVPPNLWSCAFIAYLGNHLDRIDRLSFIYQELELPRLQRHQFAGKPDLYEILIKSIPEIVSKL